MKKIYLLLICLLVFASFHAVAQQPDEESLLKASGWNESVSDEDKKFLSENRFKTVVELTWPPFYFNNSPEGYTGIGIDYKNLIEKKLGIQTEVNGTLLFNEILDAVKDQKIDLFYTTAKTSDREEYALFSKPFDQFPIAIATRKSTPFIPHAEYLVGKKVSVGKSYSAYKLLNEKYPGIDFVEVRDTNEALKLLEDGEVFAAVDILPALQYEMDIIASDKIKVAGVTNVYFELRVILSKNNEKLLEMINKSIDQITDQERLSILLKWMTRPTVIHNDYVLFFKLLLVFNIMMLLVLLWIRKLRQEVALRKKSEKELDSMNKSLEQRVLEEIVQREMHEKALFEQKKFIDMMLILLCLVTYFNSKKWDD